MVIRYVGHGVEVPGESVGGDVCSVGIAGVCAGYVRSEERRVGKECLL